MNSQTALTGAAVALGVFALWYVFRGPGRVQAEPTAQQQRNAGLEGWFAGLSAQQQSITQRAVDEYLAISGQWGVM